MGILFGPVVRRCLVTAGFACAALAPGRGLPAPAVTTDGDLILVNGAPVFLKGIDYSPFIAGDAPWTGVTKVSFADDLREIRDVLHANAVRIYDPLPKEFYDAARETGLWVIQGISLPSRRDLLAALPELKGVVEAAVEAVYERGGADVILAYALGNSFAAVDVAETIWRRQDHPRFQGARYRVPAENDLPRVDRYVEVHECEACADPDLVRTPEKYPDEKFPDPHPFQSVIAELAEHLSGLEEMPGRSRHIIGHAITPTHSAFLGARDRSVPEVDLPVHLGFLDVIFENVFTYNHAYIAYHGFPAYLERLKTAYPDKPVVVLETGYSTSPTALPPAGRLCGFIRKEPLPLTGTFGGMPEESQARALEARWVDVVTSPRPLAGFFVYGFYDEWWIGREPGRQNPNEPSEFFGLKSVSGAARAPRIAPKAAYFKVAEIYGCEEDSASPSDCGLVIRSARLLDATHGMPFEAALEAAGGSVPYVWSIDDPGALPRGLAFDPGSGRIEGIPERMGAFRFRVTVTDQSVPPLSRSRLTVLRVGPPVFSTDPDARRVLLNGEPFFLKGVDYSSFIAGDAPWTSMVIADPYEDMKEIKETLRANAIRLYQVVPQTVYDAARENGLFVIQGIHLPIDCSPEPGCPIPGDPLCRTEDPGELEPFDLLEARRLQELKDHVRKEIDEVHSFGASDTILCYVIGNEISFCSARATIIRNQARSRYRGTFYSVPDETRLPRVEGFGGCPPPVSGFWDPHPLQSMFAEIVDDAAVRELERHGVRKLMGHSTDPNMSIVPDAGLRFEPEEHLPVDFGFLDIVFQNVYSYFPPYIRYFGYRRYLEECASERGYPRTPFVILECGYSTSPVAEVPGFCATDGFYAPHCPALPRTPAPGSFCFGVNSEETQAQGLALHFEEAARPGPSGAALAAGFFVFEYYDEWWKGSGVTQGIFVQDPDRAEEWFGIKGVSGVRGDCGDRSGLTIENRLAFDTVSRMFDREWWCPREVEHRVIAEGVEIEVPDSASYDRLVVLRDGVKIADIRPAPATFTDPEPPAGPHTYAVVLEKSFIACPAVEFAEVIPSGSFRRGDADLNGRLELTDAVVILEHLFRGGTEPECLDAADADDGGEVNITDPIGILNHLFQGGPPPGLPGPDDCGPDAALEEPDLGCEAPCR